MTAIIFSPCYFHSDTAGIPLSFSSSFVKDPTAQDVISDLTCLPPLGVHRQPIPLGTTLDEKR